MMGDPDVARCKGKATLTSVSDATAEALPLGRLAAMSGDEDALRWEGDELDGQPEEAVVAEATDLGDPSEPDARPPRRWGAIGWLMLALAVAATAGWTVIVIANPVQQPSLLGLAMYQLGELLAVITPLLWWFTVARVAPLHRRAAWWFAGLLVTAPWPVIAGMLA